MKIWYIHPYAGGPGVGRYWRPYYFSKYWNRAGCQSLVISAAYHHLLEPDEYRHAPLERDGAKYVYVPTTRYRKNGFKRTLSMLVFSCLLFPFCFLQAYRTGKPDVIIYSSPHPFGVPSAWLAAKIFRAKFVFEVRDIWPLSLVELGGLRPDSLLVRITGWIEKFAYKQADKVISLLPCADKHMMERGLDPQKFLWVPNGVDIEEVNLKTPEDGQLLRDVRRYKEEGYFILVYAGAHGEPNALEGLVRAAKILEAKKLKIKILLIGKGERKEELKNFVVLNALNSVEFFEQQPKEVVLSALSIAAAGYISLKGQPIFRFGISPNKLWDYMLSGLPIIFACKAGNDPVEDYSCGFSADPEDAEDIARTISKLYETSEAERVLMGRRGHEAVMSFYAYEKLSLTVTKALEAGPHAKS
ncbi:UNVERIFIED_CONTAM: glycosyltransferase family 4 protein [Pseudomonas sp. CM11]